MTFTKYILSIKNAITFLEPITLAYFKFCSSLTILTLSATYILCQTDARAGGSGLELIYTPYISRSIEAFVLFWTLACIIDISKKMIRRK